MPGARARDRVRRARAREESTDTDLTALTARVDALETDVATLMAGMTAILQYLSLVGVPNLESTVVLYPATVS